MKVPGRGNWYPDLLWQEKGFGEDLVPGVLEGISYTAPVRPIRQGKFV
jgi:hypothetical protein